MIDIEQAYEYFNHHLAKAEFSGYPAADSAAALQMAEHDIAALVPQADPGNWAFLCAVCEQALHLLRHRDDADDSNLTHEQVEGVGSRSYAPGGRVPLLAPRAQHYVKLLQSATSLHINRA